MSHCVAQRLLNDTEGCDLHGCRNVWGQGDELECNIYACAPGAVADAKALIRRLSPPIDKALIDATVGLLVSRWESAESAEGIAAFFERRKPDWAQ